VDPVTGNGPNSARRPRERIVPSYRLESRK
jgi:hypothetical protein